MQTIPYFPYLMAPNPLYQPKDFPYLIFLTSILSQDRYPKIGTPCFIKFKYKFKLLTNIVLFLFPDIHPTYMGFISVCSENTFGICVYGSS